jgi:ketosteroid isomerase-like protein
VVTAFDAVLNAGDIEGMLALFADDAVVKTQTATFTGKQQLRTLFQQLLAEHFQFQSGNRQVTGDTETHTAQVSTDDWRGLGVAPLEARAEVVVRGGRITSFTVAYTPESLAKLQAAQARSAPAQLPRALPQTGAPPAPLAAVMALGVAALLTGLALCGRWARVYRAGGSGGVAR